MPWQKGQSGNPVGGPKDKPLTDSLRMKMFADERRKLNALVDVMYARAMSGDMAAIKEIFDRLEGKPLQSTENLNINETHYVKAPEKATDSDWKAFLEHKGKPAAAAARKPVNGSNGSSKAN